MSMQLERYSARRVFHLIGDQKAYISKDEIILVLCIIQDNYEGTISVHEVEGREENEVAFEVNDINSSLIGVMSYIEIYSDPEDSNIGKISIFGEPSGAIILEDTLYGLFLLQGYIFERGEDNDKCICNAIKKANKKCSFNCPLHGEQKIEGS